MQKLAHEIYFFDEFQLDLTRGCLFRGTLEINLRPKSFDVLKYLTENHGRLVSKDELIEAVWNETAVTDDSLVQCMKDIRHALGDDTQQIIKTVPRRGYIFEKEVTENGATFYTEETSGVHLVIEEEETNGNGDAIRGQPQSAVGRKSLIGAVKRHKLATALATVSILVTGGGIAYGVFAYLSRPPVSPFSSVTIKQLTHEGNANTVAISRDGKYLAYTTGDDDGKQSLWVTQVVASNPTQIVASADIGGGTLAFSPDGNFIYYLRGDGLYQTATFGGSTRKIRDGVGGRFSISPDGKQVVFVRIGAGDGLGSRVIVANTDGTG
jgi:DNA-binding winged helix-turn-helix (wHTH) protein